MSVHVSLHGRLGNNLFQYVVGRLIAEHHGFALHCVSTPQAPQNSAHRLRLRGPATFQELNDFFPGAPLHLPGTDVSSPVESYELSSASDWNGQRLAVAAILANSRPRQIRLNGYFQDLHQLAPYAQCVRSWLKPAAVHTPHHVTPADVVVNVRWGLDFGLLGWILPLSYYHNALERIGHAGRLYVCGTGLDRELMASFARYDPVSFHGTPIEHFTFLQRFSKIVLSNSTFAWWAAYLSAASEIYAPHSVDGRGYAFTGFQDVDLHMRESRYVAIDVDRFASVEWTRLRSRMRGAHVTRSERHIVVTHVGHDEVTLKYQPWLLDLIERLAKQQYVSAQEYEGLFPSTRSKAACVNVLESRLASADYVYRE
jgi:hypothetical protein